MAENGEIAAKSSPKHVNIQDNPYFDSEHFFSERKIILIISPEHFCNTLP